MLRIHAANFDDADLAWRWLLSIPDEDFQPCELHLDNFGPLYLVIRDQTGFQTTAPIAAPPAHRPSNP
jgi:hypothetical protein